MVTKNRKKRTSKKKTSTARKRRSTTAKSSTTRKKKRTAATTSTRKRKRSAAKSSSTARKKKRNTTTSKSTSTRRRNRRTATTTSSRRRKRRTGSTTSKRKTCSTRIKGKAPKEPKKPCKNAGLKEHLRYEKEYKKYLKAKRAWERKVEKEESGIKRSNYNIRIAKSGTVKEKFSNYLDYIKGR